MTRKRAEIVASLADRGRPELWATDDEAAVLSGVGPERFHQQIEMLESKGFPKRHPWNDKRFIPEIVEFWTREARNPSILKTEDDRPRGEKRETWGTNDRNKPRQRLSA